MQDLFLNIHHIEEHKTSMFIFLFLREVYKAVLFVEGNGREVCVNSDIAESRLALNCFKPFFQMAHQPPADTHPTIIYGNSKTAYFDAWITAKLFADREFRFNLFLTAASNLVTTYSVVQKTKISNNTSIVFQNERISNAQPSGLFSIVKQKGVQIFVTAVKSGQFIALCKRNKFHRLPTPLNIQVLFSLCHFFLKLPASLSFLLRCPVLHHQSSPFEVEGILTLQDRGFSNRSCHNRNHFRNLDAKIV